MTENKTYAQHLSELYNSGEQREIDTVNKTSTGNQCAYFLSGHHGIETPVWEFPIGPVDPWDEALEIDREEFPPVHVHVSVSSRDCDGGHGYDYVVYPDDRDNYTADDVAVYVEEQRESMLGTFSVEKFWTRLVTGAMSFHAEQLKVEVNNWGQYERRAETWSPNDEGGFHAEELTMCVDDCRGHKSTVYDQYAQMMGY